MANSELADVCVIPKWLDVLGTVSFLHLVFLMMNLWIYTKLSFYLVLYYIKQVETSSSLHFLFN